MTYQTQNGFVLTPKEVARLKRRAEILSEATAMREDGATLAAIGERLHDLPWRRSNPAGSKTKTSNRRKRS